MIKVSPTWTKVVERESRKETGTSWYGTNTFAPLIHVDRIGICPVYDGCADNSTRQLSRGVNEEGGPR
jgi:hypothetical protein